MYEEIERIIEEVGEDIIDFGCGVSEKWIQLAEERLKIKFPESYTIYEFLLVKNMQIILLNF